MNYKHSPILLVFLALIACHPRLRSSGDLSRQGEPTQELRQTEIVCRASGSPDTIRTCLGGKNGTPAAIKLEEHLKALDQTTPWSVLFLKTKSFREKYKLLTKELACIEVAICQVEEI